MSEPSSDDLMMIEEKSINNTFAAPVSNYGNTVQ